MDLFSQLENEGKEYEIRNGSYFFQRDFFPERYSDALLDRFVNTIDWNQEKMNMYGREVLFPRLTAWYGDNDKDYSFSGITLSPKTWTKELLYVKEQIEPIAHVEFNSVLLNMYRDGNDSISWHTDAEKELGRNPVIASVNFGDTRMFQLKHNETGEKINIELSHGSVLIMKGELQHYWKHQVPKTKKKKSARVNLTFRVIK